MKPLRIAMAGAGMVSRHHLVAWSRCADATVVGIADPDPDRARARAASFGIPASFDDAARMLDATRPDALDITAGHEAHAKLCALAAARGVAILCQKPLGPTQSIAEAIVAEVGTRVRLMVHENWRHRPYYRQVKAWQDAGMVGALRHVVVTARGAGLLPAADGTRPALARQPMLATLPRLMIGEVLVHHLDVACWLAGDLTVRAACARRDVPDIAGESAAVILLRGPEACTVLVEGDLAAVGAPARVGDRLELLGTAGAVRYENGALTLVRAHAPPEVVRYDTDLAYQRSYDGAIAHFAAAFRHDLPFETPPEVHLRVLALVEAAYALAASAR
ncbi:MAG: Gfo/Idh/MocA family oxidoreductase [Casimicrobiaceae bacterium]